VLWVPARRRTHLTRTGTPLFLHVDPGFFSRVAFYLDPLRHVLLRGRISPGHGYLLSFLLPGSEMTLSLFPLLLSATLMLSTIK